MNEPHSRSHRIRTLAALTLILLPIFSGLYLVIHFGVNVCSFDEFRVAFEVRRFYEEGLSLSHLYGQHVVHRHFVPLVVMVFMGVLTGFDSVACMYLSWLLFAVILGLLYFPFRRSITSDNHLLLFVPVALLTFSAAQFENFMQAFQLTYTIPLLAAVGALIALNRLPRCSGKHHYTLLIGAILLATASSLSATMGLFVWLAALALLIAIPERRIRFIDTGIWIVCGLAIWLAFFEHFQMGGAQPLSYYVAHILGFLEFISVMIGNALWFDTTIAAWIGAVLLLGAIVLLVRLVVMRVWRRHAFWIALAVFAVLSLFGIAVGRLADGMPQAMASKYTSYAMPLIIAMYVVVVGMAERRSRAMRQWTVGLIVLVIVAGFGLSWVNGTRAAEGLYETNRERQFLLYTYEEQPDPVVESKLRIRPALLDDIGRFLRARRLNVFGETGIIPSVPAAVATAATTTQARITQVNRVHLSQTADSRVTLTLDQEFVYLSGWAIDAVSQRPARGVYVEIGSERFPVYYGIPRPEIAAQLGSARVTNCGFERFIKLTDIGVGEFDARLLVVGRDGNVAVSTQRVVMDVRTTGNQ